MENETQYEMNDDDQMVEIKSCTRKQIEASIIRNASTVIANAAVIGEVGEFFLEPLTVEMWIDQVRGAAERMAKYAAMWQDAK